MVGVVEGLLKRTHILADSLKGKCIVISPVKLDRIDVVRIYIVTTISCTSLTHNVALSTTCYQNIGRQRKSHGQEDHLRSLEPKIYTFRA